MFIYFSTTLGPQLVLNYYADSFDASIYVSMAWSITQWAVYTESNTQTNANKHFGLK